MSMDNLRPGCDVWILRTECSFIAVREGLAILLRCVTLLRIQARFLLLRYVYFDYLLKQRELGPSKQRILNLRQIAS